MKLSYIWAKLLKKGRGSAIKNSRIHKTSRIESGCNIINVTFGKYSFCGYDCEIYNTDIGSFCSIANNVIIGGSMHPINWVSSSSVFCEGNDSIKTKFAKHKKNIPLKTIIGNDVWIGQCVLIKQGVQIGTGAVIGMGSIVTKNIEPYSVVAGNPAREIKKRFSDDVIDVLLKSNWWDFSETRLFDLASSFTDVQDFIKRLER